MASVFFSYSHKDETLRDQLETHLALLKNEGLIDAWHDRRIVVGDEIDGAILGQLEAADVILLLVSADFLSSSYCFSREMLRAMERHDSGEARVIPIILRHCDWHSAPFGKLLAAPQDGRPITAWPDRDEAFTDVARKIRAAVTQVAPTPARKTASRPSAPAAPVETTPEQIQLPRSSNLRLKKEFTEQDRDEFVFETFDFVCRFFEGSLQAIKERNPGVAGRFERIDSRRMAATLYREGKTISQCSVRVGGLGRSNGIAFSYDASAGTGTFNELLSVEATEQGLHLSPMGIGVMGGNRHLL